MKITNSFRNNSRLPFTDKQKHQRTRKDPDNRGNRKAEQKGDEDRSLKSGLNPVLPSCAEILGNKGGEGVAKVLYRHIGKGIYLHSDRKCRHHRCTKAVDKALHHQDAEIHDGLLDTRQHGKSGNLF